MLGILRAVLPERMPPYMARAFAKGPAQCFLPLYRMIAREVSARARGILIDIGTGPGILPLEISSGNARLRVIGTDVSHTMIAIALQNRERYGAAGVDFLLSDAYAVPLKDASADMVISTDAFHHWKQPVRVLDEMYRCLKPGCEAWVYDGFSGAPDTAIEECVARTPDAGWFFSHPRLLRCMLGIHGFSRREYATTVRTIIGRSRFKNCVCEERGIMMRMRLVKEG